ncbi:cell death abnormality protein 1-like isoform X2 [Ostrea edulis]|uniref:cell death abnormality protein 1-like isoform X2 n=1 Tax=Ostrea edulis TaxID=37623 RepID=UPI0024AFA226|nr:cell death abnormality protein 1-like isoform X2 [Ostrea edulis]
MRAALQFVLLCTFVIKEAFTSGDRICPKDGQPRECCPDYFEVNGTCVECPLGRFGINCSFTCPSNYYGRRCTQLCNCSDNHTCDSANGCVPIVKGNMPSTKSKRKT